MSAGQSFGTDIGNVSKLGQFRSPYIACPFQPALVSVFKAMPPVAPKESMTKEAAVVS